MSDASLTDLNLPAPHIHLGMGSGIHAEQTVNVMMAYEKIMLQERPDLIIVVGDVNSTLACTLAAVKVDYPQNGNPAISNYRPVVAHLEAGPRSFDLTMLEEINRIATDPWPISCEPLRRMAMKILSRKMSPSIKSSV